MAKDNDPKRLSPIALRMKEDLQLSGKGERTQESYVRMLRKFTEFLKREPDVATEDDLRNYLLYIKNQRLWSNSTINVAYSRYPISAPNGWSFTSVVVRGPKIGSFHCPCRPSSRCGFTMRHIETRIGSSRPKGKTIPRLRLPKYL